MSVSRRDVILAGLGLAVSGCAATPRSSSTTPRPTPIWPENVRSTNPHAPTPTYQPPVAPVRPTAPVLSGVTVEARTKWTRHGLAGRNINPMNGVSRITVHHEGWTPVTFTDARSTYDRIENIRQIHTRDRGWADIGYHYIIDRAGRILEGRSVAYQGAHVSDNNEHNLGILVLGNFNEQKPSSAQLKSASRFICSVMKTYRVPVTRVYTHQEIKPTECPGQNLQAQMNLMRRNGTIA